MSTVALTEDAPATCAASVTVPAPFGETVTRVREALAVQGFGVLTESDVTATLRAKLGERMEDYVILGAWSPPLAQPAAPN